MSTKYTLPDHRFSFEHKIKREWVMVDASAWGDEDGIYKVAIDAVWLDGVNVIGIIHDDDFSDIELAIEPALLALLEEDRLLTINPARDAFTLGE